MVKKPSAGARKAASKGAVVAIPKKGESKGSAVKRVQKRHPSKKVVPY